MDSELKPYYDLGRHMDFSYTPFIPVCFLIIWYKNPEIRKPLSWIKSDTPLQEYIKKYEEFVYKINTLHNKCVNEPAYDIEYANNWYNTYIRSKDLSHKYIFDFWYSYYKNHIYQFSHSMKVIYNTKLNTLEVFDPFNRKRDRRYIMGKVYRKIYEMIYRISQKMPSKPTVIPITEIYGKYRYGLQEMEERIGRTGYCVLWSELMRELSKKFVDKTTAEIIDEIMGYVYRQKEKPELVLRVLIQGYLVDFVRKTGINFTDIDSSYNSCCKYIRNTSSI